MLAVIDRAEQLYAALDDEDIDGFLALCADDVEIRYPADGTLPYGGEWHGRDGVAAFLEAHDGAEEILQFDHGPMFSDGDRVIALGTFAGRTKASGREWSTRFVHVLTFTDAGLRSWEAFFDTAAALAAR